MRITNVAWAIIFEFTLITRTQFIILCVILISSLIHYLRVPLYLIFLNVYTEIIIKHYCAIAFRLFYGANIVKIVKTLESLSHLNQRSQVCKFRSLIIFNARV